MEAMRESWTDDRLDDFRGEVNRRFDEAERHVDQRFDAVGRRFDEVDRCFDKVEGHVNQRFDEVDKRLDRLGDQFAALQRTLLLACGGIIATLIAGLISLTLTQL